MNHYPSNPEFDRYIEETSETDKIDAKRPMEWDNGPASAGLAKDIAAFANSKDGGVIVIGKSEDGSGGFILDGVSDQQASSFDTTKVANWVNQRFSPPIRLACHVYPHQGRKFIVITIDEFSDVPHLCVRGVPEPNSKNHLLKERTIYVRTANAASSPLGSIEELRALIGLATAKRGQEMLTMFNAMLSGRPLLPNKSSDELFENEFAIVEGDLGDSHSESLRNGAWTLLIRPANFNEKLFDEDSEELEERIRKHQVRLRSDFPSIRTRSHMRDWGLCNEGYRETFGLTKAGQFFLIRPYAENHGEFEIPFRITSGQPTESRLPGGKWLDFKPSLLTITEFTDFAQRFASEYGVGEDIHFEIRATSVNERQLVSTDGKIRFDLKPPCRANQYLYAKDISVADFQATWKELAAQAMKRFSGMFSETSVGIDIMRDWVEHFSHRGI